MDSPADHGRITRGCVDRQFVEVKQNLGRARRPTAKQRRAAADVCVAYRDPPPWSAVWPVVFLFLGLALAAALLLGGCVPVEAVGQARNEVSIGLGHAFDTSLPLEARQIGADEARAWAAQAALLGETVPLPPFPAELAPVTSE